MENKLEKIVSLCKRRGFIFPGSEIYGGFANSWDYGPLGVELKNNIQQLWWKKFVHSRDDMVGLDAAAIMNPKVWKASGHIDEFTDLLIECRKCHKRFKAEDLGYIKDRSGSYIIQKPGEKPKCPSCGFEFGFIEPEKFNTMLQTFIGPIDPLNKLFALWSQLQRFDEYQDQSGKKIVVEKISDVFKDISDSIAFFRPEIAQAMFVNFKNILDSTRVRLPFGIASQGKAFRNEITPGNFIFRTREFNLMELEYFVRESEWDKYFEYWLKEMHDWLINDLGVEKSHIHDLEVPDGERAHYSKRTVDIEYDYPFGRKELYGLAYRTDFDLKNHMEKSGQDINYTDPETGEKFVPYVIEPTFGIDRSVLVVLLDAYEEEGDRAVLKLPPKLAPYKVAVFPLLANKSDLVNKARGVYEDLKKDFVVAWDDRGNIGKRYYSQDEIGTPWCVTIDHQTLEDNTVTVRDRDTTEQKRIKIQELKNYFEENLK